MPILLANGLVSACAHAKAVRKATVPDALPPLPLISLEPYNPRTAWFYWNGIPARCEGPHLNNVRISGFGTGLYIGNGICGLRANNVEIDNASIGIEDHGTNGKLTNLHGSNIQRKIPQKRTAPQKTNP